MENFRFHVPTDILFGKGQVKELPHLLDEYGKKVLLVYGGGSIKKNGIYDTVFQLLSEHHFDVFECGGVEPNPRIDTVRKGAELCRENSIDVILAVGGGSTIDCAKVIAAATFYEGDAWDLVIGKARVEAAIPLVSILTIAATGSEMNGGAVITNLDTNEKLPVGSPKMKPKASILDPTYTFSVSKYQTAAGSADILSHLMEVYFQKTPAMVQDNMAEGLMKAVIASCPIALDEPDNYEARANLMWSSSLAINGLTESGKAGAWACHPIEHELSAFYDITHGIGLAILTPRWMAHVLNEETVDKFFDFAVNVWGIDPDEDRWAVAKKGIEATYECFESWGIPMTLPQVGIDDSKLSLMAQRAVEHSRIATDGYVPLAVADVEVILTDSMTEGVTWRNN